ncbi:hypothetical protein KCU62_g283, partial [Aureobasidium sp. EXF-3399]
MHFYSGIVAVRARRDPIRRVRDLDDVGITWHFYVMVLFEGKSGILLVCDIATPQVDVVHALHDREYPLSSNTLFYNSLRWLHSSTATGNLCATGIVDDLSTDTQADSLSLKDQQVLLALDLHGDLCLTVAFPALEDWRVLAQKCLVACEGGIAYNENEFAFLGRILKPIDLLIVFGVLEIGLGCVVVFALAGVVSLFMLSTIAADDALLGTLRHVTSTLSSYKQARDPPEFTTFSLAKEDIDGVIYRNPGSRRASEAVPRTCIHGVEPVTIRGCGQQIMTQSIWQRFRLDFKAMV